MSGQAIVELALVLPTLMLVVAVMIAVGLYYQQQRRAVIAIETLTGIAALDKSSSWRSLVAEQDAYADCNANPPQPDAVFLDSSVARAGEPGSIIRLSWTCYVATGWILDKVFRINVGSEAVYLPQDVVAPSPSPS